MTTWGRRGFLRGLAAAPMAGAVAVEQMKAAALSGGGLGLASTGPQGMSPSGNSPVKLTSFADWFKRFGDDEARQMARHINGLDADLIEMRLPLNTKVRMQRERNYQRAVEERKSWFERKLSARGFVDWWM